MSKKGGKDGGGKGGGKIDPAAEQRKVFDEKMLALEWECRCYYRLLHIHSEQMQRSQMEILNLKKRIVDLNEDFKRDEALTASMTCQMFQVYSQVQTQLIQKIQDQQDRIRQLRTHLDEMREELERKKAEKDQELASKTRLINQQKERMETMAVEFGAELKSTLENTTSHIQGEKAHHLT